MALILFMTKVSRHFSDTIYFNYLTANLIKDQLN